MATKSGGSKSRISAFQFYVLCYMSNNTIAPPRDTFCVTSAVDHDCDFTSVLNIRCQDRWRRHAVFVEDGTMLEGSNPIFLVTCILPNGFNVTVRDSSKRKARRTAARMCLDECDELQTDDERSRRETLRRNVAVRLHAVVASELPTAGGKSPVEPARLNQRPFPSVPPLAAYVAASTAGTPVEALPGPSRAERAVAVRKIFEQMSEDELLALIR